MSAFDWFSTVTNHPVHSPEDFRSGVYIKDLLETLDSRTKVSLPNSNPRNNITFKFNWSTIIQCLQDNKIIAKGEFTPENIFSDFSNQIISLLQKIQQKYCSQPQKIARLSKEKLSFFQDENGKSIIIQNLSSAEQIIAQLFQAKIKKYNRNIKFKITYHQNTPVINQPKKFIQNLQTHQGSTIEGSIVRIFKDLQRIEKFGNNTTSIPKQFPAIDDDFDMKLSGNSNTQDLDTLKVLSIQIQSHISSYINQSIQPIDIPNKVYFPNSKVSILVDISASMTSLSKAKKISAMYLATGIIESLSDYGVEFVSYAFGDRSAMWRLGAPPNSEISMVDKDTQLQRIVDSLNVGERFMSYPLDAILTAEKDWNDRRYRYKGCKHIIIVISDFISPQSLDKKRIWEDEGVVSDTILISLQSNFNTQELNKNSVPSEFYANGCLPHLRPNSNIHPFIVNPEDISFGSFNNCNASFNEIANCISSLLNPPFNMNTNIQTIPPYKFRSIVLTPLIDDFKEVIGGLQKPSEYNQKLEESIKNKPISMDFFDNVGNPDLMFNVTSLTENTKKEPYLNGQFDGFNILVVILYMGETGSRDESIKPETFNSGCGKALKSKGFSYKLVYSYGDAIEELMKDIDGQCPYCEVWIFCSPGYGELSTIAKRKARDQDLNKIIPFLKTVNDFWLSGGGLFVFSDNEPFTFEINYLLENIMTFNDGFRSGTTKVRFTGKYDNPNKEKAWIEVIKNNSSTVGKFIMADKMDPPGKCPLRFTLRPGLVKFFEGTTISEATDKFGAQLSKNDLWPFKAFAWTTDTSNNPHPFILYFDPLIPCDPKKRHTLGIKSPGPIILHGGFTSAFAEFHTEGTGRLIISIACWLTRFEERQFNAEISGQALVTTVPALKNSYFVLSPFTGWNRKVAAKHSILILDGSGSMDNSYSDLIVCANDYISICERNGGIVSVVEFDDSAQILRTLNNRRLAKKEGFGNGGTSYSAGLSTAIPLIDRTPPNYECRILFFTDGRPNYEDYYDGYLNTIRSKGVRLDAVGFGDVNQSTLNRLCQNGGTATIGHTMTEVGQIMRSYAF